MTVTLGRCTGLDDPWAGTLSMKGDLLSFDSYVIGVAQAGTVVDDMNAKVQQLRGLMDNVDEDVFPATFSEQPEFDGFYTDFDVTVNDAPAMLASGACPFTVSMRRVAGAASALFENTGSVVVMTNSHGLPTVASVVRLGLPYTDLRETSAITDLIDGTSRDDWQSTGTALATLTTDDGLVRTTSFSSQTIPGWFRYSWATTPALFYEASCKAEQSFGGTYYPLQGQQNLPPSTAWRVSNGLVRINVSATKILVAHYDGAAWDTAKEWVLGGGTLTYLLSAIKAVRIIKNTPQHVVVKCGLRIDGALPGTASLDISLRRGCRFASFTLNAAASATGWYISNGEAGSALTGGFKATSADASGNKYVVASPQAQTNTLASGKLELNLTGSVFYFCIGSEVGAGGDGQTVINQYIDAISEEQRVVSR